MRARHAAFVAAFALIAADARAADPAARAAAEASCARGADAATALHFADALEAYRAAIAIDPSAPCARVARARADDLAAHAEGGFAPLAKLEAVRRDPRKTANRAEIEALERDLASFPEGRVRAEARLVVGEAWWHTLGDPARAIASLEAAAADRSGDPLTRSLALSELWTLRQQRGEIREALAVLERDPTLNPELTIIVRRAARREHLRAGAIVILALLVFAGAAAIARLSTKVRDVRDLPSRLVRPSSVAFALYLGGAGAILVRAHGGGDARPFLWLGLGVLALMAIARALPLAVGVRGRGARAIWAVACVAGVVAAAFLAVERTDASYLESIGL